MSVRPRIPGQTSRSTLSGLPAKCRTAASVETSIFSGPIRPSAWTVHDAGVDDPQPADTKTASEETSLHRCLFGYPCTDR